MKPRHKAYVLYVVDDIAVVCMQDLLWRSLLVYRGRINMDHCVVHHLPDGRGAYAKPETTLISRQWQ